MNEIQNDDEQFNLALECFNEFVDFINPRREKYPPRIVIYTLIEVCTEIAYGQSNESIEEIKKELKAMIDLHMEYAVIKYQEKGKENEQ